jgi:hypothetical protein
MIRVTVDPRTARAAKFRKPTPYDGLLFGEWVRERNALPLGVTAGRVPEAVGSPIRLDQVTKLEIFLNGGTAATPSAAAAVPGDPTLSGASAPVAPPAPPAAKDPS